MAISLSTIMARLSRQRRARIEARAEQLATDAEHRNQSCPQEPAMRPADPKKT